MGSIGFNFLRFFIRSPPGYDLRPAVLNGSATLLSIKLLTLSIIVQYTQQLISLCPIGNRGFSLFSTLALIVEVKLYYFTALAFELWQLTCFVLQDGKSGTRVQAW